MIKKTKINQINELLDIYQKYDTKEEHIGFIKKAYEYALEKHGNRLRLNGEPYINHTMRVALILTDLYSDYMIISTALLHEVVNKEEIDSTEFINVFGEEVKELITSFDRISNLNLTISNESMIQSQRKIFVGLAKDVRVIILKIADRLDNMRHLDILPVNEQKQKAIETLEIISPIAHRLGLYTIKGELEDLALKYSKREAYDDVVTKLAKSEEERNKAVLQMKKELIAILEENNIKYEIKGRTKSIYSIYKKLDKGRMFKDIYDLLALRILIEKEQDCYFILGLIHSKYKYIPKRFKDYIAIPKNNMYQSLHTTIFGNDSNVFEIQIRTFEMNELAEHGIASHWSYKEKGKTNKALQSMEQKLEFFRNIIESNEQSLDPNELLDNVKSDILNPEIYVYTPNGDVIELPIGSTPIDFAYKVHSKVAESMIGAIVNNNIVPLSYELESGDIVKINTSKTPTGPKLEWLNMAKTTSAKGKIKSFFTKSEKENCITKGEQVLQKEMRKRKLEFQTLTDPKNLNPLLEELKLKDLDDLYNAVGANYMSAGFIINTLIDDHESKEDMILKKVLNAQSKEVTIKNDVIVEGIDEIKVTLAKCCTPILQDEITGYITKGAGISVHRKNCPNITLNDRTIDVKWNNLINKKYKTIIQIEANKVENGLINIISKSSLNNIGIDSVNTNDKLDKIVYEITVLTPNKEELEKYISTIYNMPFVDRVERIIK